MITEQLSVAPANDDLVTADTVPGHLASRRIERRLMLGFSLLAIFVLASSLANGLLLTEATPDLATFAARV